jgi:hypothetical protein
MGADAKGRNEMRQLWAWVAVVALGAALLTACDGSQIESRLQIAPPPSWERVADLPDPNAQIDGVALTSHGFFAYGAIYDPVAEEADDFVSGALWRSVDGRDWAALDGGDAFASASLRDLGERSIGLLATGMIGFCVPHGCDDLPADAGLAVWLSGDGETWERVPQPAGMDGVPRAIVATADRWIIYGNSPPLEPGAGPEHAVIWTSGDGRQWAAADTPPGEDVEIHDLVATGEGLLAIGRRAVIGGGDIAWDPVVWRSRDGLSWDALATIGLPTDTVVAVSPGADGAVALGAMSTEGGDSYRATIASSADGERWHSLVDGPGWDGVFVWEGAADGGRLVVAGTLVRGEVEEIRIWSLDGSSWRDSPAILAGEGSLFVNALGVSGDTAILFAMAGGDPDDPEAESGLQVWIGPVP